MFIRDKIDDKFCFNLSIGHWSIHEVTAQGKKMPQSASVILA